jgi:hypothetical protein
VVKVVSVDSNRIIALTVEISNTKLLIIDVYMPVNDGSVINMNDLCDELYKIQYLLESHPDYLPVIGGDFNVDWSRDSLHTQCLSDFINTYNLRCIAEDARFNIDHTYHFSMERFSIIDHFLLLQDNFQLIKRLFCSLQNLDLDYHSFYY